jgi:pimeloyl-ACP methyl ester carboxylesterase
MGAYRPARQARRVTAPLLVVVADDDQTSLAAPAIRAARRAPNATVMRVPGGHYAPFLDQHERVVSIEIEFLTRHLLDASDRASATQAGLPREVTPAHR